MTDRSKTNASDGPLVYQIRLEGLLGHPWAKWFGDVTIRTEGNETTLLTCAVVDQAALHGLLRKVRDLGLPLLSVARVKPDQDHPPERQP